jgi:hypothetical protein
MVPFYITPVGKWLTTRYLREMPPRDHDVKKQVSVEQRLLDLFPSTSAEVETGRSAFHIGAEAFDRFAIEVVRLHVERQAKPATLMLEPALGETRWRFDGLVTPALGDLPGPTAVEVMSFISRGVSASLQNRLQQRLAACFTANVGSLLLVWNVEPDQHARKVLDRIRNDLKGRLEIEVWGPRRLQEVIIALGESGQILLANLKAPRVAAAVLDARIGRSERWRLERRQLISLVREAWRNDSLVLFLGAGVSIDAGIPGWDQLLGSLFGSWVDSIDASLAADVAKRADAASRLVALQSVSPLLTARHLRKGLEVRFLPELHAALYRNVSKAQPQLEQLAQLCDPPRGRLGSRAVVTYNFDDLLEQQLAGLHTKFTSIFQAGMRPDPSALPIYHVHGFIPQVGGSTPTDGQNLVFSEEGYHQTYNDPYAWSNVVQLNLLSEHTCLFVGLSMTDPNLRRLLEIANRTKNGLRHVALLKRTDPAAMVKDACPLADAKCSRHDGAAVDKRVVDSVLAAHHQIWEDALGELGVRVLWYEAHSEIPSLIREISGA